MKIIPILEFYNTWKEKDFLLGLNLASENNGEEREYYLNICLGFLQIAIGLGFELEEN